MFVREAKRLRIWRAPELEVQGREFLCQLTIELYSEKGFDNRGHTLAKFQRRLVPDVQRAFERSREWRYLRQRGSNWSSLYLRPTDLSEWVTTFTACFTTNSTASSFVSRQAFTLSISGAGSAVINVRRRRSAAHRSSPQDERRIRRQYTNKK